jgi:Xaa-Pro dipeptidase
MGIDLERIERTRKAMRQQKIDALFCRLPENIVMLTGYWPMNGFAFLIFPVDKDPVLIAPVPEEYLAVESWVKDLRTFKWGLVDSGDPYAVLPGMIKQAAAELGLGNKRIGYEGSFEFIASPYVGGEPGTFSQVSLGMLRGAFGENLTDATGLIHKLRLYKTPAEAVKLRLANEIALMGVAAFFETVAPGNTEIEVASAVESAIMRGGTGYKGVKVARAWASVMSGPRAVAAYKPHLLSTQCRLEKGDVALLELATVVDGWWSDLTRTRAAGAAKPEDLEKWEVVVGAQQASIAAIRPGVPSNVVDKAGRDLIAKAGLGKYFIHHTGHGVGLRYHEPEPFLHPDVKTPLEAGMVSSVEPGIYIEGWGGMRCEDNILVTETGVEVLSEFSRRLDG